jgi:hypothetical protein
LEVGAYVTLCARPIKMPGVLQSIDSAVKVL